LVDITVRPAYAGGPPTVLDAFRFAVERVDPSILVDDVCNVLDTLAHVYPYHQALGYYFAKAGTPLSALDVLRARGMPYTFHLCHRVDDPIVDRTWNIYVPGALGVS
jgi:hypothetical protein